MNAPSRFDTILESALKTAKPSTTFEPCRDGVLRHDGGRTVLLTPEQVSDLMAHYEREQKAAEAEAELCAQRFAALWKARCDALDRCGAEAA